MAIREKKMKVVYDVLSNDYKRYISTFSTYNEAFELVLEHPALGLNIRERQVPWYTWLFWKIMR